MKKGFALTLTLWIVAMMSLASALYLSYGKRTVQKTKKLEKKLEAILKTESTIELLRFYGATGSIQGNKIVNHNLVKIFPSLPKEIFIDGRELVWGKEHIVLEDTAGLIGSGDIDALSSYLVSTQNTLKDKKVIIENSIKDWIDDNGFTLLNGAETSYYQHQGYSYTPRNQNYLSSLDELFLIRGLTGMDINRSSIKSNIVLSDYVSRNVLTMDLALLAKVYKLSKIEVAQLREAKKESSDRFFKLFYKFRAEVFNSDGTGITPSRIVKLRISYVNKEIHESVSLLISFRLSKLASHEILEYNN